MIQDRDYSQRPGKMRLGLVERGFKFMSFFMSYAG